MEFSKEHGLNEILDALNEMFEFHPILKMCVNDEYEVPYLVGNSKPQIVVESEVSNEFILEYLTQSFDLHECLCKFLIIENDDSFDLYGVFHHIICDARSCAIFKDNLQAILNGQILEVDDSLLKVSAFSQQIQESEQFAKANDFYDNMLVDCNEVGVLLDSVGANGPGSAQTCLDLDSRRFLKNLDISENVLFTSVFSYTLSQFVNGNKVIFTMIENGRDRFKENFIGMTSNVMPVVIGCKDQSISSYVEDVSDKVY